MTRGVKLTNQDRLIILGITLILFFGVFLIGKEFTGMYSLELEQSYCNSDEDCMAGQACCLFYKENTGICDKEDNCIAIQQITKEEKEKLSADAEEYEFTEEDQQIATEQISAYLKKPAEGTNYISLVTGLVLLILGIVWIIYLKKG